MPTRRPCSTRLPPPPISGRPGGRRQGKRFTVTLDLLDAFRTNPFLDNAKTVRAAPEHIGTQGDGNHFLFIGRWRACWEALQIIRKWLKTNHKTIHRATVEAVGASAGERFRNEHNFVFLRGGLYLHGKGATPGWAGFAADADLQGCTIIPLNMAEPVLIVRGADADSACGFSPRGAGRNWSRTEHMRHLWSKTPEEALAEETVGLEVRFHAGKVDASELPSSYKPAAATEAQIGVFGLAEVVDRKDPYGCIIAGDVPRFKRSVKGRRQTGFREARARRTRERRELRLRLRRRMEGRAVRGFGTAAQPRMSPSSRSGPFGRWRWLCGTQCSGGDVQNSDACASVRSSSFLPLGVEMEPADCPSIMREVFGKTG